MTAHGRRRARHGGRALLAVAALAVAGCMDPGGAGGDADKADARVLVIVVSKQDRPPGEKLPGEAPAEPCFSIEASLEAAEGGTEGRPEPKNLIHMSFGRIYAKRGGELEVSTYTPRAERAFVETPSGKLAFGPIATGRFLRVRIDAFHELADEGLMTVECAVAEDGKSFYVMREEVSFHLGQRVVLSEDAKGTGGTKR